jgi:glycosyltransferase involved in cell wall biosynthesis
VTHHGPDYDREKWGGFAKWLLKKGEMFGMLYANKRIVISKLIKSLVYEKYGLDSIVIPNGVVIPEIPVTKDALEKFSLIEKRYILFVSRFVPEKRHLDLLEAFKAFDLPGWKLVLVGGVDRSDKYHLEILSLAEEIPGVVITDFQRGKSLQELYAHAGMFVLPSSHEGLPIALLEALSYGLPVIASDIPANLEIGLPRTNYFPLGNSKKLAVSMHELAIETKDDSQRELWRLWVGKRYQWQRVASCTYNLYKDLMSEVGSSVL